MLTKEDNELLVRTGPGTPMGNLMRRFWAPVMLADEIGGPDSAPVRVSVLGQNFVAFRDSAGTLGLLDAYCPHRRANLFWGRNEQHGLRCVYHGWKFDVHGQCVDMPNCPEGTNLATRVKVGAYPVREQGGIVWAYLGPPELEPPFPRMEMFETRPDQRMIYKLIVKGNYFQMLEGDIDSSHVGFLHSRLDGQAFAGSLSRADMFSDHAPVWTIEETDYGLSMTSQRKAGEDRYQYRVTQHLFPWINMIAAPPGERMLANMRIPIDDETTLFYRVFAQPLHPLTAEERAAVTNGIISPEMRPGSWEPMENLDNDYLIDRDVQRTETFTGIRSVPAQDLAIAQDQGGLIADRSKEYLVSSDRAIIAARKKFLTRTKELMRGIEPPEAHNPDAYAVRAADFYLPRDVSVAEGARELLLAGTR
jgi:phenylpropionate dioxygenase-like ring-hydroxylating dioxygenase large terminal subunit